MSWAARRRFIILFGIGAVVVAFLAVVLISALYKTPSCTDGVQNQAEDGIDCGGPCKYLCTEQEQPPTVLFTKVLQNSAGRTDIIAEVENKNVTAAARDVPYRITLYGSEQEYLGAVDGKLDLPPGATEPIYLPGVSVGKQRATSAFLEISPSTPKWFTMTSDPRVVPKVVDTTRIGTIDAPRIGAILENPSATTLSNVRVIVFVRDLQKDIIAASETVAPTILGQGQVSVTFTWNGAFIGTPSFIEVIPIIPLPAQAGLP